MLELCEPDRGHVRLTWCPGLSPPDSEFRPASSPELKTVQISSIKSVGVRPFASFPASRSLFWSPLPSLALCPARHLLPTPYRSSSWFRVLRSDCLLDSLHHARIGLFLRRRQLESMMRKLLIGSPWRETPLFLNSTDWGVSRAFRHRVFGD